MSNPSNSSLTFKITRVTSFDPNFGKKFSYVDDELEKGGVSTVSHGLAEVVTHTLASFKEELEDLQTSKKYNGAYVLGVPSGGIDRALVLYNDAREQGSTAELFEKSRAYHEKLGVDNATIKSIHELPIISLTHEFLEAPEGPSLVLLDYDYSPDRIHEDGLAKFDAFHAEVVEKGHLAAIRSSSDYLDQKLEGVGYLQVPSSSNGILGIDGTPLNTFGTHTFIPISSGQYLEEVREAFRTHLMAEGWLWPFLFQNGTGVQIRTGFDTAVFQPTRLTFEAPPKLVGRVTRKTSPMVLVEGEALNASALKNSRKDYEKKYSTLETKLQRRGYKVSSSTLSDVRLTLDDVLYVSKSETVTIRELYERGENAKEFGDPIEGLGRSKGYNHKTAMYIHDDRHPRIFSHAHGGILYPIDVPTRVLQEQGVPYGVYANVAGLEEELGIEFRYNEFTMKLEVAIGAQEPVSVKDIDLTTWRVDWSQLYPDGPIPHEGRLEKDLVAYAHRYKAYHPVRDYFNALPGWDGKERLSSWLVEYGGAEDNPYTRLIARKMLLRTVSRVFFPGCKVDSMTVLIGDQGIRKSTLLSSLAIRKEWFSDSLKFSDNEQKVIEQTQGKLVIEVAELSGLSRAGIEEIKSMMSKVQDSSRMAYGFVREDYKRQFAMFGTTNKEEYWDDDTGARRNEPVKLSKIDIEGFEKVLPMLYAEALYHLNEALYVDREQEPDAWAIWQNEQRERQVDGGVGEMLEEIVGESTTSQIAVPLKDLRIVLRDRFSIEPSDTGWSKRISQSMMKLGFTKKNVNPREGKSFAAFVRKDKDNPTPDRDLPVMRAEGSDKDRRLVVPKASVGAGKLNRT